MLRRCLGGLVAVLVVVGFVAADEFRGTITKIEDGSITVQGQGKFNKEDKKFTQGEEKTFKIGDAKIKRVFGGGKDGKEAKEPVSLTADELKTAAKVTTVFVTVVHEGDKVSEVRVGGGGGGGFFKDKKKTKDKGKDDKTDND